jgi:hypothetical protein
MRPRAMMTTKTPTMAMTTMTNKANLVTPIV